MDELLETIKQIIEKIEPNATVVEFIPAAAPELDEDQGEESEAVLQ